MKVNDLLVAQGFDLRYHYGVDRGSYIAVYDKLNGSLVTCFSV